MVYNPFENFREWARWDGEDCSYLAAYCEGCKLTVTRWILAVTILVGIIVGAEDLSFWGDNGPAGRIDRAEPGREPERR